MLIPAGLTQILCSVRAERELTELTRYDPPFRGFVGTGVDDPGDLTGAGAPDTAPAKPLVAGTGPDARLYKKSPGTGARFFLTGGGRVVNRQRSVFPTTALMGNRPVLIVQSDLIRGEGPLPLFHGP
ncbi:hypothetical protein M3484_12150 [Pseudomonas sp. GX19020]|uniref:hypothetical protein n=1 Tax=Pseudomonas sp. GX19020 TaxID=2942277 RepID=UPI0020190ECF|nr:hypothetical protein [Pseudomonas sp. GX19020]MCL4067324.1 hypothetical protein [Pseudomonas sp. GX19020]